ncbi:putative ribosome-binding factor A, mitochondrial [Echinops telfairi]|uniref:Ribosome-binding factor A, mitochondrial n=1 Tax=Echinops telfairi TaxID=9371 RepID=A0ABM0J6I1_ECHTE|nr:putative ribosome-binding factor A, mitochondrial [Echinops telfairi]
MWVFAGGLWGGHARLGLLLGGCEALRSFLLGCPRGLHGSLVSCGNKNLLKKFASKTKKKFWYESPSLGTNLTYKPSKLDSLMKKTPQKTRKEDHVRLRVLNGLLHKALADLLSTSEVSQEVYDLNVELSKVSLTSDFSACRVYWRTSLSAEQNEHTSTVLQKSAAHMRHLLMSQQILRNVPPIIFIQDREGAALAEVDRLLAIADFGPPDEKDLRQDGAREPPLGTASPGLYGIDHEALHQQVLAYKRQREQLGLGRAKLGLSDEQEQLVKLARQMKRRKKTKPTDHDISPKSFLSGGESEDSDDGEWPEEGVLEPRGQAVEPGIEGQGPGQRV